jgi:hypothetical protein
VQFDPKNSLHLDYVRYSACLWAKVWGVVPTHHDPRNEADNDYLRKICEEVPVPAFQPKQNKVIETDENAKKEDIEAKIQQAAEFDEAAFNAAIDRIKELLVHKEKYQMFPEEFEKVPYITQKKKTLEPFPNGLTVFAAQPTGQRCQLPYRFHHGDVQPARLQLRHCAGGQAQDKAHCRSHHACHRHHHGRRFRPRTSTIQRAFYSFSRLRAC